MKIELSDALKSVTKDWKAAKKRSARDDRVSRRDLAEMRRAPRSLSIKDAAYAVMVQAYMKASGGGRYPANARQVMYAARPLVLEMTDGECWKNSAYFTQTLLPDFVEEHYSLTAGWDVVYDARGHIAEPHTGEVVELGTLAVRQYIGEWSSKLTDELAIKIDHDFPTSGPSNRFKFALFIEKEGFDSLWKAAHLAERFDMAIMSTKGMSVTSARHLVDRLSQDGVTILVLHDFDKAGFSIFNTLGTDTRRYTFAMEPTMIDLGLRLDDVTALGLDSEPVEYNGGVDPRNNLRDSGATEDECNFLVSGRRFQGDRWRGKRVELNAMTSDQILAWLEGKLTAAGVTKLVPDQDVLTAAYKRAARRAAMEEVIDQAIKDYDESAVTIPADLPDQVSALLAKDTALAWDEAIWALAAQAD